MKKETEEKLACSLTAETTELLPFLPYLLQDFWELGIDPDIIVELISRHVRISTGTRVLDLACGKGAVAVKLAEKLRIQVKGIDLIPEFIDYAVQKAHEFQVENWCSFIVGDINEAVNIEKDYDCVVYGAVGSVMGTPAETLKKLKKTVKPGGFLLLDNYDFIPEKQWAALFRDTGLVLVEAVSDDLLQRETNDSFQLIADSNAGMAALIVRAHELMEQYPDKKTVFEGYIRSQQEEYELIENQNGLDNVTWILRGL